MLAFALMAGMFVVPFVLWAVGMTGFAVFVGVFVALCIPSMIHAVYLAIKTRTWPKITGGPSIAWNDKRIGF